VISLQVEGNVEALHLRKMYLAAGYLWQHQGKTGNSPLCFEK